MLTVRLIVLMLALVLFALAALDVKSARVNLTAAGLFMLTLAFALPPGTP